MTQQPQPSPGDEGFLDAQEARLKQELDLIKEKWLERHQDDISYLQEAAFNHYNIIVVIGLAMLTAVTTVIGLAPLFFAVLVAWELCWLTIASQSERFRRSIRAQRNAEALGARQDKRDRLLDSLPEALKARHSAARKIADEIKSQAEAAEVGEIEVLEDTIAKLDYMLEQYARMLLALHKSREFLKTPEAENLAGRIESLAAEVEATEPGRLRTAKEKNLGVLRQRLERAHKSEEEREYLEVSLDTLENTLKLVRDRVIAATTAQGIAASLDEIILEMGRHRDYMDQVDEEIGEAEAGDTLWSAPTPTPDDPEVERQRVR